MIPLLKLLTFLWLAIWTLRAVIQLSRGIYRTVLFVIPVLFLLTGVPLLLDILIGVPTYDNLPGFALSSQDALTNILYCFYVSMIPPIWWRFGNASKPSSLNQTQIQRINVLLGLKFQWIRPLAYVLLVLPLILIIFSPAPTSYLKYGAVLLDASDEEFRQFHSIIRLSAVISIVSAVILLLNISFVRLSARLRIPMLIVVAPWLILNTWVHGKRSVIAITILLLILVFWSRGGLRGMRLIGIFAIAALGLFAYSYLYQTQVRSIDIASIYQNIRIDYGRDDVIKMTLFAELNPSRIQILEYRGQSLLFYLTMYVPRSFWPDKPYPYAQYFTSALFLAPPRLWGWGMTTSWLEEAIANFSWFGMGIGPLVIGIICRIGDKANNFITMILTVLIASLFLVLHLVAFASLFIIWAIVCYSSIRHQRKKLYNRVTFRQMPTHLEL